MWQATWARGYEDVVAPAPAARLKEEGFIVFSRAVGKMQYAAIIDTTRSLWALVTHGSAPPLGSRVRIVPAFVGGEIGWDVTVLETLGLGMSVRFGQKAGETTAWATALRYALNRIGEAETERRRAIVAERKTIMALEPIKPFREELDALHEELRKRVDAETAGTAEERIAFERGNEKQRKAVVEACRARRLRRYNEEVALLRTQIPDLQAAHDKRLALNAVTSTAVAELEDAASRSRSISERVGTVEHQLAAVEAAGLPVSADVDAIDLFGAPEFNEIARTVELLFDLIPRRAGKR